MARPTLTIDLNRVRELAAHGLTREQIAASLGISPSTLYNKQTDLKGMTAAIRQGRAESIEAVANVLYQKALSGDTAAALSWLKYMAEWGRGSAAQIDRDDYLKAHGDDVLAITRLESDPDL